MECLKTRRRPPSSRIATTRRIAFPRAGVWSLKVSVCIPLQRIFQGLPMARAARYCADDEWTARRRRAAVPRGQKAARRYVFCRNERSQGGTDGWNPSPSVATEKHFDKRTRPRRCASGSRGVRRVSWVSVQDRVDVPGLLGFKWLEEGTGHRIEWRRESSPSK